MPCIFILSAVSYLKTEIILFHVREKCCALKAPLWQNSSHSSELYSTAAHLMVISHVFKFLFIYALFIWELRMSMLLLCFIFLAHHTTNSDFSRGKKRSNLLLLCLSQVLAKVMKLCAIKVWLEFIYFWTILLCQCVCRDDRSMHRGPVRFANMKIKHNDNKNGEELNIY